MSNIVIRIKYHILDCEKVEGGETEFLGFQIDSFEKLKEIPNNFKEFTEEDLKELCFKKSDVENSLSISNAHYDYNERMCAFLDIRAMNEIYKEEPDSTILYKYTVYAKKLLKNELNETLYVFDNDSYSKFVYLFNLEKRLFQWTC